MGRLFRYLRQAEILRGGLSDGELLECFIACREEAAFEALVRRHGPMVLGVCRRVLGHGHDAEDAFQATFLVLVRKAASIVPRELVGSWLYGVAYRTALKAKAAIARRRARERQARPVSRREADDDLVWRDLRALLDQELSRLPDKYRVPIVLCHLEGKSRREVARLLGWPEGTLSSRLAAARAMLARRLARRHGLALSAAGVAAALSQGAASAGVPGPLVAGTVQVAALVAAGRTAAAGAVSSQAAVLMEGVLQAMFLSKLKIATGVVLGLAVLVATAGWVAEWSPAAGQNFRNGSPLPGQGGAPSQPNPRSPQDTGGKKLERNKDLHRDPDDIRQDLDRKLSELKEQTEQIIKQRAILEIELAVKKLKQSRDEKEQESALGQISQAVMNYREKVLKIKTDVKK
jgi:RNA polymerase sigma-70 factor (ECF subfamily)